VELRKKAKAIIVDMVKPDNVNPWRLSIDRWKYEMVLIMSRMCFTGRPLWLTACIVISAGLACPILAEGPFHGQVGIAIERSFGTGEPGHLKQYLPKDNKIYLAIPAANVAGGNYSRNQIMSVLRQMFERVITRSISLQGGMLPNLQRGPIRGIWRFADRKTNKTVQTTLYFTITSNPLKPIIKSIRGESN